MVRIGILYKKFFGKQLKEIEMKYPKVTLDQLENTAYPNYPDWVQDVLYPEPSGAPEKIYEWRHYEQRKGFNLQGNEIHKFLKDKDMIKDCLGLRELEELQKKEFPFGTRSARGMNTDFSFFGWNSVVQNGVGELFVPYLWGGSAPNPPTLFWRNLKKWWDFDCSALLFSGGAWEKDNCISSGAHCRGAWPWQLKDSAR